MTASSNGTTTNNNLSPSQSKSHCLLFSLGGHKDVVHCIVPLPNRDVLTAGGRHDATTQIWLQSQLKEATSAAVVAATISPPPIFTTAATTTNLCNNDADYVFAVEVLKDFKIKSKYGRSANTIRLNSNTNDKSHVWKQIGRASCSV